MTLDHLINQFIEVKDDAPTHVNELLDFLQRGYIQGDLSIVQYRDLYRQLNERGAEKPALF
jgi:hypothetical protein